MDTYLESGTKIIEVTRGKALWICWEIFWRVLVFWFFAGFFITIPIVLASTMYSSAFLGDTNKGIPIAVLLLFVVHFFVVSDQLKRVFRKDFGSFRIVLIEQEDDPSGPGSLEQALSQSFSGGDTMRVSEGQI